MNTTCVWLFIFLIIGTYNQTGMATQNSTTEARQEDLEPADPVMIEVELKVVDPEGHPVANAEVYCTGLRTRANPASHYVWRRQHGERIKHKTDDVGIARVRYPKFVKEKLETGQVTWSVDHDAFMAFRNDVMVDNQSPEIQLKRGCRLALNAVHSETGEKITSDLYAVMGLSDSTSQWKLSRQGMLVSPVFSPDRIVFRVVYLAKEKPSAFSDLIVVEPKGRSRVLLKDVKIFPGVRVEGEIDDAVPRPIKDGLVQASFVNNPNDDKDGQNSWVGRWQWSDATKISEDGTFVFESVPRDEFIQMFVKCDGWSNARPKKEVVLEQFPQFERKYKLDWALPHFEKLTGKKISLNVPMSKNSEVEVTVTDPTGKPLADSTVFAYPQQLLFDGGGVPYSSTGIITRKSLLDPIKDPEARARVNLPATTMTNRQGKATLLVPPSKNVQVSVAAQGYQMGINRGSRSLHIDIEAGKSKDVSVKMSSLDSEKLGENPRNNK